VPEIHQILKESLAGQDKLGGNKLPQAGGKSKLHGSTEQTPERHGIAA
jgi:hypothetical protein